MKTFVLQKLLVMKSSLFILLFFTIAVHSCVQSKSQDKKGPADKQRVGGPCEGCEAIFETPMPFHRLSWVDTMPDFREAGPKLEISGIVYKSDGKTPAADVVVYAYHTDQTGHYPAKGDEKGWGKRHGYLRSWVKTNKQGGYKFFTLRPAAYPNRMDPAHIHIIIKEPDKNEYYIDDIVFDDDPLLTSLQRKKLKNFGGNGVVKLEEKRGIFQGERNIYLGRNIPDYPQAQPKELSSGLDLGDNCPAFDPLHLSGADMGKKACPMCKYGYGQGVMVWFNHTNLDRLKSFAQTLEKEMENRGEKALRVFLVYMNPGHAGNDEKGQKILQGKIKKWCEEQSLQKVAVVWVPSPIDEETCGLYKINPKAENTVFIYKKRKIAAKWINMDYSNAAAAKILQTL
jgi:protocatechuate 3,4-dioxygenase beta subunit